MTGMRFPLWTYGAVAAGIAGLGFASGAIASGTGVAVVAGASLMWTAYNARRFGKVKKNG